MTEEEAPVSLSEAPTRRLNMIEAINEALHIMMERDRGVVVFGEDEDHGKPVDRRMSGVGGRKSGATAGPSPRS